MKSKLIFFTLLFSVSYGKPKIFVLEDSGKDKYYLSDSIKIAFRKKFIEKAPLIVIDGVPFDYRKNLDTITLPLKKIQITSIGFISKKSSPVIYGADANSGAVVINTIALQKYTSDTIRAEQGR